LNIQEHIGKISWSVADKFLYVLYGLVLLFQINALTPEIFGLYQLLIALNTWFFIVADSFALQGIIQFGANEANRKRVNLISLIFCISITIGLSLIIFIFKHPLSTFFHEQRLIEIATFLPLLNIITIPRVFCIKLLYRDQRLRDVFFVDLIFFGTMTIISFYLIFSVHTLSFNNMLLIYFTGTTLSSILSIIITRKDMEFGSGGNFKIKDLASFGIPMVLQGAMHSLPRLLDVFIVLRFFSATEVGIYASAKNLYRIFDQVGDAAYGLIYPSAVKAFENNNQKGLTSLMTKGVSFMMIPFLILILVFELGFSDFFITTFLPYKYFAAVGQFNLMILAAIGIPFIISALIITASGKPKVVLAIVTISTIVSFATFYIVGKLGNPELMPLGIISYNFVFGIISYFYLNKKYEFPFKMIFRSIGDSINYIKKIINGKYSSVNK
jgi:O-antigen/teichoic acid export membrane protein